MIRKLTDWLTDWHDGQPLDHFFGRLFHELTNTQRFKPQPDTSAAAVCQWLLHVSQRHRLLAADSGASDPASEGPALIRSILQGIVSGCVPTYPSAPDETHPVIISTLYTYLLGGHAVDVQVWRDASATAWWYFPRQPLSNAFVLTPHWPASRLWSEADSIIVRKQILGRIIAGLCSRCRRGNVLATSEFDRRGQRQERLLWRWLQPLIARPFAIDNAPAPAAAEADANGHPAKKTSGPH